MYLMYSTHDVEYVWKTTDHITYSDIIFQANAVIDLIGFPSYISNHTLLNQEYEDVRYSWILEKTMS